MCQVSILVPSYNHARFIRNTLESLQAQTFAHWEAIVVDDGSEDETSQVVAAIHDERIHYEYQPNHGCPAALNKAFHLSTGAFVLILAADDWLLPTSLHTLVMALQAHPKIDVVFSDGYIANETGELLEPLSNYRRVSTDATTLDDFVIASPVVGVHSAMFRRPCLERLPGPFDEQMLGYEDWDLFIRLKAAGAEFLYVPEKTCCYRFHGGNKSAPKSSWAERRRQSLLRNRLKVLNALWFDSLSNSTRYQFFYDLLTAPLKGDVGGQDLILVHPSFLQLEPQQRAVLIYYMTIENMTGNMSSRNAMRHLWEAIRIRPQDIRLYIAFILALLPASARQWILSTYRNRGSGNKSLDSVTQILRAKNVA